MTNMDSASFRVVYVDRRAARSRTEVRSNTTGGVDLSTPPNGVNGDTMEDDEVCHNIQTLLSVFPSVCVCASGKDCISALTDDIDRHSPDAVLVLLDAPLIPDPDEIDTTEHDGRHDSGIATSPADTLYGISLLRFIIREIDNKRMPTSVLPVVALSGNETANMHGSDNFQSGSPNSGARELQCIDLGACDAFSQPLSIDRAKALHHYCYRYWSSLQKSKKRAKGDVDQPKPSESKGNNNYSYLREKMVSELMTEICKPKSSKFSASGTQIRISRSRVQIIRDAVGRWCFSAHDYSDEELVYCAQLMFEHAFKMPEVEEYRIPSGYLTEFLIACRAAYNSGVPYHNFRHVVDVLQAVFYFLLQLGVLPPYGSDQPSESPPNYTQSLSHLITPLDALTLLVVAIGHDVGHPGVNNAFLVTLKAPLAQVYNDRSVLESFHCAAFSQVLQKYWPKTLSMRKMMIDMILATDMGLHFDYMGKLDKLKKKCDKDGGARRWDTKTINEYRNLLCALLIKCADISNVARIHEVSAKWATILIDEFARQANIEIELGIPSSLVAPPVTGSILALAKSQVGFMNLFAMPLFENLSHVLPEMHFSVKELNANRDMWSRKIEAYTAQPDDSTAKLGTSPSFADSKNVRPSQPIHQRGDSSSMSSRDSLPPVLGTVLMESDMPQSNDATPSITSGAHSMASPVVRPVAVHHNSDNGNTASVTVVVTHPPPANHTNGFEPHRGHLPPLSLEKTPKYQHSTEHLRGGATPSEASDCLDRPRSSPPELSDHSCSKGCCGPTVVTTGQVERRSSRFFKKVRIWKPWRKGDEASAPVGN